MPQDTIQHQKKNSGAESQWGGEKESASKLLVGDISILFLAVAQWRAPLPGKECSHSYVKYKEICLKHTRCVTWCHKIYIFWSNPHPFMRKWVSWIWHWSLIFMSGAWVTTKQTRLIDMGVLVQTTCSNLCCVPELLGQQSQMTLIGLQYKFPSPKVGV